MDPLALLPALVATGVVICMTTPMVLSFSRGNGLTDLNTPFVMYFSHLLAAIFPALLFFTEESRDPIALNRYLVACLIAAFCIPFGAFIADAVFQTRGKAYSQIPHAVSGSAKAASRRFFFCYFFLVALPLIAWYLASVPSFTLKELLQGSEDHSTLVEMRQECSAGQISYLLGLSQVYFVPFLFILVIATWPLLRGPARLIGVAAITLAVVNNGLNAAKTPVVHLLTLAAIYLLISKVNPSQSPKSPAAIQRQKRHRKIGLIIVLLGVIGYPMTIFLLKPFGKSNTLSTVVTVGVLGRVMYRPANNAYTVYSIIPEAYPHTHGMDMTKLALLLGREPIMLKYWVSMEHSGVVMNAPPPSIGTFYAQFGWLGLVCGVTLMAFVFRALERFLLSTNKLTVPIRALYVMLLYGAFRTNWANFHSVFLSELILPLCLTLAAWRLLFWRPVSPIARPSLAHLQSQSV